MTGYLKHIVNDDGSRIRVTWFKLGWLSFEKNSLGAWKLKLEVEWGDKFFIVASTHYGSWVQLYWNYYKNYVKWL